LCGRQPKQSPENRLKLCDDVAIDVRLPFFGAVFLSRSWPIDARAAPRAPHAFWLPRFGD